MEELFTKWEELLEATDSRKIGLEQALSLVHFNRKVTYIALLHEQALSVQVGFYIVLYLQRITELTMNEC